MTDPLNTTDTDAYPREGGLNSSDTQDWADPKMARTFRLLALVILPSLFVVIAVAALWWALTHPRKPDGLTSVTAASGQRAACQIVDRLDMAAGSNFRHHSAKRLMLQDLRMNDAGEHARTGVIAPHHRYGGFIATRFHTQDCHRTRHRHSIKNVSLTPCHMVARQVFCIA